MATLIVDSDPANEKRLVDFANTLNEKAVRGDRAQAARTWRHRLHRRGCWVVRKRRYRGESPNSTNSKMIPPRDAFGVPAPVVKKDRVRVLDDAGPS